MLRPNVPNAPGAGAAPKICSLQPFQSAGRWTSVRTDTLVRIRASAPGLQRTGAIEEDTALMAQTFTLNVNGKDHKVEADPDMPLLYALRNDIGLNNPHFGCGLAQCGACTVHIDGQAIRSCVTPVSSVGDGKVVTLAGLGTPEKPHPLQTAYVEEQVPQCGYCINGWIMTAAAFLRDKKKPTDAEIKTALEGLKCRCGTHLGIIRAVKRASEMMG
jgi:nicotinate dehydrogenase subunit A